MAIVYGIGVTEAAAAAFNLCFTVQLAYVNSMAGSVCRARWVSAGPDRGLEVGMLLHLRIRIRVSKNNITNKTKNISSQLQYASSHAANNMTVKHVIADTGVIADAKQQTWTKCAFRITGFTHYW